MGDDLWNRRSIGASGACRGIDGFMIASLMLMVIDKFREIVESGRVALTKRDFLFFPLAWIWVTVTFEEILEDFSRLFAKDDVNHISHISAFITDTGVRKQRFLQTSKFASVFIL